MNRKRFLSVDVVDLIQYLQRVAPWNVASDVDSEVG